MSLKVIGIGTIVDEPKFRTVPGKKGSYEMASFTICTDRKLMMFPGRESEDMFIVEVFCRGELKSQLKVGAQIELDGFLVKDQWEDKDGKHKEMHRIRAESICVRGEGTSTAQHTKPVQPPAPQIPDDDVPF